LTGPLPAASSQGAAADNVAPLAMTLSTRITSLPDNISWYLCGTLNMPATFFVL
jgi:hypothetical protein